MRDMEEVGVVLTGEQFAEVGGDHDVRGKIGVAEDMQAVARSEVVWVDGRETVGVGDLG